MGDVPQPKRYTLTVLRFGLYGDAQAELKGFQEAHFKELASYLEALGTKTIVIEDPYVDRDFLEDYVAYFARCFTDDYSRYCRRLHFFTCGLTKQQLRHAMLHEDSPVRGLLQEHYLGFLVVRPLPRPIGRTCLVPLNTEDSGSSFPLCTTFKANLFGIPLRVVTVPFQEQDGVVALCATSSLWTAFQITGRTFLHRTPSPNEITMLAATQTQRQQRIFPNDGLMVEQMVQALSSLGLEAHYYNGQSNRQRAVDWRLFRAKVYAYTNASIPPLWLGRVGDLGKHAVVITGYHRKGKADDILVSDEIDVLYVHDDHSVPFAASTQRNGNGAEWNSVWTCEGSRGKHAFETEGLLFPLYHKIRIPLKEIYLEVMEFDACRERSKKCPDAFLYDIRLLDVAAVRAEVTKKEALKPASKIALLSKNLPHYLWRVTVLSKVCRTHALATYLFDATGIKDDLKVISALFYDARYLKNVDDIRRDIEDAGVNPDENVFLCFHKKPHAVDVDETAFRGDGRLG